MLLCRHEFPVPTIVGCVIVNAVPSAGKSESTHRGKILTLNTEIRFWYNFIEGGVYVALLRGGHDGL